jgi:hypothetical protein
VICHCVVCRATYGHAQAVTRLSVRVLCSRSALLPWPLLLLVGVSLLSSEISLPMCSSFWELFFHVHNGQDNNKIIIEIKFLFMIVFIPPIVRIPLYVNNF